jgi:hypothetical protein
METARSLTGCLRIAAPRREDYASEADYLVIKARHDNMCLQASIIAMNLEEFLRGI